MHEIYKCKPWKQDIDYCSSSWNHRISSRHKSECFCYSFFYIQFCIYVMYSCSNNQIFHFLERSTKTRSGPKSLDYRQVNPKLFEEGGEKCPISVYKEHKRHWPVDTLTDESRFYLRPLGKTNGDIYSTLIKLLEGISWERS